jgi:outer membrane protein TolC
MLVAAVLLGALVGCNRYSDLTIEQFASRAVAGGPPTAARQAPASRPASRPAVLPRIEPVADAEEGRPMAALGLGDCQVRALANSLAIRIEGYRPAMAAQDVIAAEAVFDAVFFLEGGLGETNQRTFSAFEGTGELRGSRTLGRGGLRQRLPIGVDLDVFYQSVRTSSSSVFVGLSPQWDNDLGVSATVNLLRGAGLEVNQAQITISRLTRRIGEEAFRGQVIKTLDEVAAAYWRLVSARRTYRILQDLVDATGKTHETVLARKALDASDVNIKNAESSLNQRKVLLVRARSAIQAAEDALVNLINDPDLPLERDFGIRPTDEPTDELFTPDRTASVQAALANRPELQQADLAVAGARAALLAADNGRLPALDLGLQWTQNGTAGAWDTGNDALFSDSLYDWMLTLKLELPVGNRQREAAYRKAFLEVALARKTAEKAREDVLFQVNDAIRELATTHQELVLSRQAADSARQSLDAIIQRMEKRGDYSPTFLDLRLNAEAAWIQARRGELDALTNYNLALWAYLRVTGTTLERKGIHLVPAVDE